MPICSQTFIHACMLYNMWCMNAWTCFKSGVFVISRSKMSLPWSKTLEKGCHMPISSQKVYSCMHAGLYMIHECMNMLQIRCFCNFEVKNEFAMIKNPRKEVSHALFIEMSVHAWIHAFKMHGHANYAWNCTKSHEITKK